MTPVVLRNWQVECKEAIKSSFLTSLAAGIKPEVGIGACVGSGKSTMMADIAHSLMFGEEGSLSEICPIDLSIVVAPNRAIIGEHGGVGGEAFGIIGSLLKYGLWPLERITAERMPLNMACPDVTFTDSGLITGASVIFTYQYLSQKRVQDTLMEWVGNGKRIALFFDEIHHVPQIGTAWSESLERVKAAATCVSYWSGTWYRTDKRAIMGQETSERPRLTYCYSYADGIRDGHVRPVSFWVPDTKATSFDKQTGLLVDERPVSTYIEDVPTHIKKEMFDPNGWFVEMMIRRAAYELEMRRRKYPDAGCLVVCQPGFHKDGVEEGDEEEDRHAELIHRRIVEITGKKAFLVLNGDPSRLITEYRESNAEFIVAVNRVSEGCDIPRLRIALILRDLSGSDLLFEQIVGRIIRRRPQDDEQPALVVMSPIHAMCEFAREIAIAKQGAKPKIVQPCPACNRLPCSCPCHRCGRKKPCGCPCARCGERPCICVRVSDDIIAKLEGILDNHITQGTDIESLFAARALSVRQRYDVCAHRDVADMALLFQLDAEVNGSRISTDPTETAKSQTFASAATWVMLRDAVPIKVTKLQKYFSSEGDAKGRFKAAWQHITRKFFRGSRWVDIKNDPSKLTFEILKEINAYLDRTIKGNSL